MIEFVKQSIPEIILLKPKHHGDARGYFIETFNHNHFEKVIGYKINFCQDNESKSVKGVLRGLHFQYTPWAQSKLVRVIDGAVLDIAVDIRKGSPTYGQHVSVELNDINKHQLFIPRGFAHGFVVLSNTATFAYKVDNYYSPENEGGIFYNDSDLKIDWKILKSEIIISEKDKNLTKFRDLDSNFDYAMKYYD